MFLIWKCPIIVTFAQYYKVEGEPRSILALQGSECVTHYTHRAEVVPNNSWDTLQRYLWICCEDDYPLVLPFVFCIPQTQNYPNKTLKESSGQKVKMYISKRNKRGTIVCNLILKLRTQTPKLEDFKKKESFSLSIFMQFNFPRLLSPWVWGSGM